jgi:AraC family transcriptional activator of pobA
MYMAGKETDGIKSIDTDFFIFHWEEPGTGRPASNPHRHNYQEIIFIEDGEADHTIDGEQYSISAPFILLIAQGKMHSFNPKAGAKLWGLRFTNGFLQLQDVSLFSQYMRLSKVPVLTPGITAKFTALLQMMMDEFRAGKPNRAYLQHLTSAYLSLVKEEKKNNLLDSEPGNSPNCSLFNRFLQLLEENFAGHKSVEYYAEQLNITPKKLQEICRELFGETPSQIIAGRVMLEARRLLLYTSRNIQEISFALGHEDHSYFTKVFRKNEGITPTRFRELNRVE